MAINPQIEALRRLQISDLKMVNLERRLAAIPKRLAELTGDLAKLEAMLQSERDKLGQTRDFKHAQEMQLRDEEDHIRNSKTRLGAASSARELNATQREIDTTRRLAQSRSEEIAKITSAIEETEAKIDGMEKALAELRAQADGEKTRLETEKNQLEATLGKTRSARDELVSKVDRPLFRTYERIRKRAGGIGFVAVRERRCTACKMTVAHSMYVALRRGDEILHCENCGRLLYFAGHFPHDASEEEPKPKPKPAPQTAS
jgi:uncharacterized protein